MVMADEIQVQDNAKVQADRKVQVESCAKKIQEVLKEFDCHFEVRYDIQITPNAPKP